MEPEKKPERSAPANRFPQMVDDDERPQWFPLVASLPGFLREKLASNPARWLVLELFQHLSFASISTATLKRPSTLVEVTDATLKRRSGLGRDDIRKARNNPQFRALVTIAPGAPKTARNPNGTATVYDLHKLMLKYNSWAHRGVVA